MKKIIILAGLILCVSLVFASDLLASYKQGVLYQSLHIRGLIEDMYIDKEAILALQRGENLPNGTVIVMEEYADNKGSKGRLNRIISMQKKVKEWEFKEYKANRVLNSKEDGSRCKACHMRLGGEDIVFTLAQIKAYHFE